MSTEFSRSAVLVQIYEIQTPQEAEQMIALGVDHVGSVLLSASEWKNRDIFDTVRLCRQSAVKSSLIPLFDRSATIKRVIDYYRPDIIHFCDALGGAASDRVRQGLDLQAEVKKTFPDVLIMRSIPIAPSGFAPRVPTLDLGRQFEPVSDFFLTDTYLVKDAAPGDSQPVTGFIGITGRTCDWPTARRLVEHTRIPVILAGGVDPDNVKRGIEAVKPAGVDSCTGTNAVDHSGRPIRFKKDPARVKRLVDAARRYRRTG